jgi:hypothetical protein
LYRFNSYFTASYVTRGSSSVAARGNGQVAIAFDPAGVRGGNVISDIFMKRGFVTLVGIVSENEVIHNFKLYDNYPNPFNPSTKIKFEIGTPLPPFAKGGTSILKLVIFDILGREIAVFTHPLRGGREGLGTFEVEWNASEYPSGVYFYSLQAGDYKKTKRMVLIK